MYSVFYQRGNKGEMTMSVRTIRAHSVHSKRRRYSAKQRANIIAGTILGVLIFLGLFPYVFMLITSLKDNAQFFSSYWLPAFPLHFENYIVAWNQISHYLYNSLLIAAISTVGTVVLGSVSAFALSRKEVPGRQVLFGLISLLLMVPFIASLIPLFVLMHDLHLLNTYLVLILPYIASGSVLSTFLMRTFIEQIPEALFEAARLDGANGIQIYLRVVMPLSGPIIGTITMITLINVWNDYFWPLLTITDDSLRTVSIGVAFFQGQNTTLWGPLFAGYFLASLPLLVIFTFASRYFIAGLQGSNGGGVK
jgi:ABC-type glycerol-3-phosphate transport system permease component